jgi:phospholipase/lecithinase/hemolysin
MLKKVKIATGITALLASLLFSLSSYAISNISTPITGIVAFGDSLSDNGNLRALKKGDALNPPYFLGRCSNSLVWVEILTSRLILPPSRLEDLAIAGAQTHNGLISPPGMLSQVQDYLNQHATVDPNRLYVVWAGGDNYIYHPYLRTAAEQNIAITRAMHDIKGAITELSAHGAHYFLVPNLPDIGITPLAQKMHDKHPKLNFQSNLTQLSVKHNNRLTKEMSELATKLNVTIVSMDVYSMMQSAVQEPTKFGLKNANTPCYTGGYKGSADKSKICDNPDDFLFWDVVHPTFAGHNVLANLAFAQLEDAGLVKVEANEK